VILEGLVACWMMREGRKGGKIWRIGVGFCHPSTKSKG